MVIEESENSPLYQSLLQKVSDLPYGTIFHIKILFGEEWNPLTSEQRRGLGKIFKKNVSAKAVPDVLPVGADGGNEKHYVKTAPTQLFGIHVDKVIL